MHPFVATASKQTPEKPCSESHVGPGILELIMLNSQVYNFALSFKLCGLHAAAGTYDPTSVEHYL